MPKNEGVGNPDPCVYKIQKVHEENNHVVALVSYPDCVNYEGLKILVLPGTVNDLLALDTLDPHFCEGEHLTPVARFKPTPWGWNAAVKFVQNCL